MNSPKEKAKEIFDKYNKKGLYQISDIINRVVRKKMIKQCALIAVNEIKIEFVKIYDYERASYWRLVEQEISKL